MLENNIILLEDLFIAYYNCRKNGSIGSGSALDANG